ncbi:MAG: hypothetical protein FJ125_14695, partial [Deltaproteobacteria bacterium]|nr:hypothetical protein [Deltaproteobacteria bacterium]
MVPHRCRFLPWFAARLDALLAPPLFLLLPLALASGSVGCQRDESGGLDGPDDAGSQPLPGRLVLQVAPPAQAVTAGRGFSLQVTVQAEGSLPVAAGRRALRARRVVDGAAPGDGDVLGEVELAAAPAPGDAVPLILPLSLWSDGPAGEARLELRLEPAPGAQQAGAEDTPRLELAFAVTAWPAGQEPGAGDRRLRVTLDPATGVVRQARAVQRDLQLCEEPGTTAWTIRALDPAGGEQQLAAEGSGFSFREVPADGDPATAAPGRDRGLLLRWRHPGGALVRGALLPGEREGEWGFSARIEALAGWTWLSLQYPVLSGIGGLTRRGGGPAPSTYLVLPAAGGYLLHDPGLLLPREERWYRYPDGAELPLQLLAYCRKEGEGFYLALLDDTETARQLGFFREPPPRPDRLRAGVVHLAWDRRPGAALEPGGVVTLGLLDPGEGWQGAAERYR